MPPYSGLTEEVRRSLASDPVLGAAELLARIAHHLADIGWPLMQEAKAFNGEKVVVCWRDSEFVRKVTNLYEPPSTREHPSLTTLSPAIVVSPVRVHGFNLTTELAKGPVWEAALGPVQEQLASGNPKLSIHLDTLGPHGLTGWSQAEGDKRGHFAEFSASDLEACKQAAREAVQMASSPEVTSILVLPELAGDDSVVEAIRAELRKQKNGRPSLTIVGLRHAPADDGGGRLARFVNEAVILGPNGKELWRHRKLSVAGSVRGIAGYGSFIEDIQVGRNLNVIQTPFGNVAVVICLDTFAENVRMRLAGSPANVLLVPSLSTSVKPHRESLQHLVKHLWAIAFVCNRSPIRSEGPALWNGYKARSFWAIALCPPIVPPPKRDELKEHPSFVFELANPKLR
jgi:predicted amidohydrolase